MKIQHFIISMPAMAALCLIYAFAIGIATFIEDAWGTETARALIYNARWMEILYVLLAINLAGNLFRYQLWRRSKRMTGLFHCAFLVILSGAALTRYAGKSGLLHFREGEKTNLILTDKSYLKIDVRDENRTFSRMYPILFSAVTPNRWSKTIKTHSETLRFRMTRYWPEALPVVIEDSEGEPVVTLKISEGQDAVPLILRFGDQEQYGAVRFHFDDSVKAGKNQILIGLENNQLFLQSADSLTVISMMQRKSERKGSHEPVPLERGVIYQTGSIQFALHSFLPAGRIAATAPELATHSDAYSALEMTITGNNDDRRITLFGGTGVRGQPETIMIDGTEITLTYGSLPVLLPFALQLDDFIIERYPGSRMPSAYESRITLMDSDHNLTMHYRIYMNHILKYRGFRFYQSSYDEDEHGSILSVTRDPGTPVTYAGYTLLILGLIIQCFNPVNRFRQLGRKLGRPVVLILILCTLLPVSVRAARSEIPGQEFMPIDTRLARGFGRLTVQDERGRMKPVNTMAHELLRELRHPEIPMHLSEDQWMLLIFSESVPLRSLPLIPLDHPEINKKLGLPLKLRFASQNQLYDLNEGTYLLESWSQKAGSVPKNSRTDLEKAVLLVESSLGLLQQLNDRSIFRLFPVHSQNLKWVHDRAVTLDASILQIIDHYKEAVRSGNMESAEPALLQLSEYQNTVGGRLLPSRIRMEIEIFYHRSKIFQRLAPLFSLSGIAGFLAVMMLLLKNRLWIQRIVTGLIALLMAGFGIQTLGLILRWAASGHAPWTNKYESMIYIAWALMLAGIIFVKNHSLTLFLAAMLSGGILDAAHMSWADPRLTNLVPVLKSHWLLTHVSVITASYGFFGLAAMTGLFTLCLIAAARHTREIQTLVQRLTWINERVVIIGLTLLMIGNLLGAVWANESWGRYWGWDPKETWTLILILLYAVLVHLKNMPGIDLKIWLNIGTVFAFWALLMTYIGVNFYLSGVHSYAAGEAPPVPGILFIIMGLQLVISVFAVRRQYAS